MPHLRRSPLHDRHRGLGARLTSFADWEMPLHYGSVVREHRAVRSACGVFDLSHLGTLVVTGGQAEACVQHAFTNDAAALGQGRAQYSLCLNEQGGILDDLLVYRLPWGFFVVPNAANTAAVQAVLDGMADDLGDCAPTDVKADLACIAVQGPQSAEVLAGAGIDVAGLEYLDCGPLPLTAAAPATGEVAASGAPPGSGVLARSGYTGERGYELFVRVDESPGLWDRVVEAGAVPAGLGARDTLRLEMGYPLHGNDIHPGTSPAEARLGWAVKVGTGFRGEAAYRRAKEAGPARRLWGLRATGRGIPRAGCAVSADGQQVGETTSGGFSPTLNRGIALAYLDTGVGEGAEVRIDVRGKPMPAEVLRPPFVVADPRR
jgi:aminomethyltransferase